MTDRLLYSVNDALKALSISRAKFYAEAKAGKIKLRKIGVKTVVTAADLAAYVDALPAENGPRAA
ncbi:helix-turn-helix domain-containing protein [Xanthobacter sp. DSM 14520]|uniref:helix-turn-helix transcriptional regulator n=1 Tax=Xanthobacter autotrophicus (strain ATCC BAA-1158 / Py2) TaxID=78245 RepID=UPI00372C26FA